jgi:hypothetical protein
MGSIIHLPKIGIEQTPDVRPLAWALARMQPEALAVMLPGEDLEDCRARRAAAADILEELLIEYADTYSGGDDGPGELPLPRVLGDAIGARWTLAGAA